MSKQLDNAIERLQQALLMFVCMCLLGYMWYDLGKKVESGKPFQLNDKWYQAKEVSKP